MKNGVIGLNRPDCAPKSSLRNEVQKAPFTPTIPLRVFERRDNLQLNGDVSIIAPTALFNSDSVLLDGGGSPTI